MTRRAGAARGTMKAVLLTGHGGLDKLEYREDVPVPEPAPGEVLVEVGAAGVNNTDIWTREGAYGTDNDASSVSGWRGEPLTFPRIQGVDIAGRIVTVGEDVSESRVSERVVVDPTLYTDDGDGLVEASLIGSERDGGFAEYVAVPAPNAHRVRSGLSDVELASFPCAYVTAERMLNRARVGAGEAVLVTGASGGVGSALVQLAKLRGAWVAALVGPGKEDRVREIGADAALTRGAPEALAEALATAARARRIDVVADVIGGAYFPALIDVLRPEGRYVVAGAIAGPVVPLDLRTLYLKHLEMIGSTIGTRQEFAAVLSHIESGRLAPLVAAVYPLRDLRQAQQDFFEKRFFGKLVVVPGRMHDR